MSYYLHHTLRSFPIHLLGAGLLLLTAVACSDVNDALPTPGGEPAVEVVAPADRATLTSDVVTMTCVVSEDVERVSYTVNGGTPVEVAFSSREYSFPLQGLVDGKNTVELTVQSASGTRSRSLLDIVWLPNNRTQANDDYAATELRRPSRILVLGNDRGRSLEIDSFDQPENGSVIVDPNNANRLEYTAAAGFTGLDTFGYTIVAGNGGTDAATVSVNVLPRNPKAPTANDDTATTVQNTAVGINVLANDTDPDNDPVQVLSVSDPENGTVELYYDGFENRTTAVIYTPDAGFTGTDTFTYDMTDSDGFNEGDGGDTATVTVTVE